MAQSALVDVSGAADAAPEPPVSPYSIEVNGLSKSFGQSAVLHGVSFHLRQAEAVALIGANGSGKSTLLRCCLRLIEPDEGHIVVAGENVRHLRSSLLRKLRSKVGFVFQKHNLVPRLSALSNVVHGAQGRRGGPTTWLQGLAPHVLREEALACLDCVGLAGFADRRADQLSGGQSQRVAIARALMQRPRLIFADEPVASLDPRAGEEVMELFSNLMRQQGLTVLFTSHDLRHAVTYTDRILGLSNGKIALDVPAAGQRVQALRALYA